MKKSFEKVVANIIVGVSLYTTFGLVIWGLTLLG